MDSIMILCWIVGFVVSMVILIKAIFGYSIKYKIERLFTCVDDLRESQNHIRDTVGIQHDQIETLIKDFSSIKRLLRFYNNTWDNIAAIYLPGETRTVNLNPIEDYGFRVEKYKEKK